MDVEVNAGQPHRTAGRIALGDGTPGDHPSPVVLPEAQAFLEAESVAFALQHLQNGRLVQGLIFRMHQPARTGQAAVEVHVPDPGVRQLQHVFRQLPVPVADVHRGVGHVDVPLRHGFLGFVRQRE
ncbi:hypothetical protein RZS08_07775, partial [Arthrospira platensis SPKY1]|nr:hypothetical protein [Arthrospira platensis SPKY1]